MIFRILAVFVLLAAALLIIAALRPADFHVVRSATIAAPAATIFDQVNDLHQWQKFSPWAALDPSAKIAFEGPHAGVGAAFTWAGNSQIGTGRMTLTENRPAEFVRFRLDFVKPMAGTSTTEFTFKPAGGQTVVSWSMSGKNNLIARLMCLVVNMDKVLGGQFEKGLASLKAQSEAAARK